MAIETERRQSGVWTVLYQPEIPQKTISKYQQMFWFLRSIIINRTRFDEMSRMNMSCIHATSAYAIPTDQILKREFNFKADNNATLIFSEKINTPEIDSPQSGQNVLRIYEDNIDFPFAIIDPACYLYGIPYEKIPIAVGDHKFIERAMGELYSNGIEKNIETKLLIRP